MDALKSAGRALLRSPSVHKPSWAGGRHKKLPENWTDTRETLLEGMLFSLKYLGMTLVEQPKGEELSAAAVKRIVATAKASGKKLQKVTLKVSPRGIVLRDSRTNELIENISIYRISYCTADKAHDKVFAYIAQSQQSESLECHAFLCPKRKMAQAVTLTVAQAFRLAFEFWQAAKEEKEKRERSILAAEGTSSPSSGAPAHPVTAAALGNLLDLEEPGRSPLGSSTECPGLDNSSFGPSPSVNNNLERWMMVWTRRSQGWPSPGPTLRIWTRGCRPRSCRVLRLCPPCTGASWSPAQLSRTISSCSEGREDPWEPCLDAAGSRDLPRAPHSSQGATAQFRPKLQTPDVDFCTLLSPNHRMLWDIFTHSLQVLLGGVESTCRAWVPPEPPGASPGQAGCRHSSVSLIQPAWTAQHLPGLGGDLQQLLRLESRREQSWCFVQCLWHPHSCHSLCSSQLLSNPKTFLTPRSFAL